MLKSYQAAYYHYLVYYCPILRNLFLLNDECNNLNSCAFAYLLHEVGVKEMIEPEASLAFHIFSVGIT